MELPQTLIDEVIAWRQTIHANPELGFEEHDTAGMVATLLRSFGIEVVTGVGGTGVVGTLRHGIGPTIGIRADMDALPVNEMGCCSHKSHKKGVMHACGHDGHTASLLGAAKYLSEHLNFQGTVHFIFQPAEENLGGAIKMIDDGLFKKFPMDAIYAFHNWPGLPVGHLAVNPGAMMASLDSFEIQITGKSCHAAMPDRGKDPIVVASQLVLALQTITSRTISPLSSVVVSITQIQAGEAINVIPETATVKGTMRCLNSAERDQVKLLIEQYATQLPDMFGLSSEIHFFPGYPVTMNSASEALFAYETAKKVLPVESVHWAIEPSMASEDFACMLQQCQGAYLWIGADGEKPSEPLHNAYYDFNDAIIPTAISLWVQLVNDFCVVRG